MTNSTLCFICNNPLGNAIYPLDDSGEICWKYDCAYCGKIKISNMLVHSSEKYNDARHILSGVVREIFMYQGDYVELNEENLSVLLTSSNIPKTVMAKVDKLIVYYARQSHHYNEYILIDQFHNYPITYSLNQNEYFALWRYLVDEGLMTDHVNNGSALTFKGWERYEQLKNTHMQSKQCFIAMSFNPDLNTLWKDGIEKAIIECKYNPYRVDSDPSSGIKIDDKIIAGIRASKFMIADFTEQRNGVYYEAGFAQGLGIPVIRTCNKLEVEKLHFDTRQYPYLLWETVEDLYMQLIDSIHANIL